MIRTEGGYQNSLKKIVQSEHLLRQQEAKLVAEGFSSAQINRGLEPNRFFIDQIRDEVENYERLKKKSVR